MKKFIIIIFVLIVTNSGIAKNYFSSPKKPSAKLILDSQKSTSSLASVSLLNINGKEIIPRAHAVWLKPGNYKLKFSSHIRYNAVNTGANKIRNKRKNTNNELTVKLEKDKTYYIAYDTHDKDLNAWQPVVWKIE